MRPGPKPKPTARRVFEGHAGHRRLNENEPHPPEATDAFEAPPAELTGNDLAVDEWRRLALMLRRLRVVTEADRSVLIALCLEWSRYLVATKEVATKGMIIAAPNGYPIVNPYLSIATRALAGCTKLWPELGLTPSSRARVTTAADFGVEDAFAEFDSPPPSRKPS